VTFRRPYPLPRSMVCSRAATYPAGPRKRRRLPALSFVALPPGWPPCSMCRPIRHRRTPSHVVPDFRRMSLAQVLSGGRQLMRGSATRSWRPFRIAAPAHANAGRIDSAALPPHAPVLHGANRRCRLAGRLVEAVIDPHTALPGPPPVMNGDQLAARVGSPLIRQRSVCTAVLPRTARDLRATGTCGRAIAG
jgi:hypothetical protein